MKVTIKKGTGAKGMVNRTKVHVLTVWVDLTKEEKQAASQSGLNPTLLDIDQELNKSNMRYLPLWRFLKDSGPVQIIYETAFDVHAAGEEFKEGITLVANAIKMYQAGEITGEESFEL